MVFRYTRFIYIVLFASLTWVLPAQAEDQGLDPKKYVQELSNTVVAVITDEALEQAEKETKLTELFKAHIDTAWISRFVVGRYWRKMTKEQRSEYSAVYQVFLINRYIPNFNNYTGEKFDIGEVKSLPRGDYIVSTHINTADHPSIRIDYRLRERPKGSGQFKIIDIISEGISLITTQRSEFSSLLSRHNVAYLIKELEKKSVVQ